MRAERTFPLPLTDVLRSHTRPLMEVAMPTDASALRRLGADLRNAAEASQPMARVAVDKAAYDIEAHAKENVAVDTGTTKNSIGVDRSGSGTFARAVIGPTTEYAPYLESGTYKMAPQPFMGPAFEANEAPFVAAVEQIGGQLLE